LPGHGAAVLHLFGRRRVAAFLAARTHPRSCPVHLARGPPVPYRHRSDGPLHRGLGFLLDPLSSVMILVVTGIGFLIHVYSTGYMAHDNGYYRFFGYLNLFVFFMLMLVLANNYE